MKAKKGLLQLLAYIFLNILVSAATMLLVLILWNQAFPETVCPPCEPVIIDNSQTEEETVNPAAAIPPIEQEVIQIDIIYGVGHLEDEQVVIQRVGEGDLYLAGWYLIDDQDNRYEFPAQLVLKPGAELQLNSGLGQDSAVELFWNATSAIWQDDETARIYDPLGNLRAEYLVP